MSTFEVRGREVKRLGHHPLRVASRTGSCTRCPRGDRDRRGFLSGPDLTHLLRAVLLSCFFFHLMTFGPFWRASQTVQRLDLDSRHRNANRQPGQTQTYAGTVDRSCGDRVLQFYPQQSGNHLRDGRPSWPVMARLVTLPPWSRSPKHTRALRALCCTEKEKTTRDDKTDDSC